MTESVPEALRPIQEWLGQHDMELTAINSIDETSITVDVSLSGRLTHKLQLDWNFLLHFSPEQVNDYLERHDFAMQLRRGDLCISRSAP
jgi:hypothetical protein